MRAIGVYSTIKNPITNIAENKPVMIPIIASKLEYSAFLYSKYPRKSKLNAIKLKKKHAPILCISYAKLITGSKGKLPMIINHACAIICVIKNKVTILLFTSCAFKSLAMYRVRKNQNIVHSINPVEIAITASVGPADKSQG